jgi:hypothetical protein
MSVCIFAPRIFMEIIRFFSALLYFIIYVANKSDSQQITKNFLSFVSCYTFFLPTFSTKTEIFKGIVTNVLTKKNWSFSSQKPRQARIKIFIGWHKLLAMKNRAKQKHTRARKIWFLSFSFAKAKMNISHFILHTFVLFLCFIYLQRLSEHPLAQIWHVFYSNGTKDNLIIQPSVSHQSSQSMWTPCATRRRKRPKNRIPA